MPAACTSSASIIANVMRSIYLSTVTTQSAKHSLPSRCKSQSFLARPRLNSVPLHALSRRSFTTTSSSRQYVPLNSSEEDKGKGKSKSDADNADNADEAEEFVLDIFPTKPKQKTKSASNKAAEGGRIKTLKGRKPDAKEDSSPKKKHKPEGWQVQKAALQKKFKEGWNPPKKISPDSMDMIRHLHSIKPEEWTTPALAAAFKVSPEVIRRILRSKWQPTEETRKARQERWERRHDRIWSHMVELGLRQPKRWAEKYSDAEALGMPRPK
ncbi:hypothetical protein PISL3812_05975 [Talaromyces islandicus]|uniref:Required for respiratory growth protein 9, mitochondrial n=1 Tax=Talaromyces islandicus TaxID=28573 RepID=A0A0U1M1L5_TALIS|nr:hypothetical protein PISL3812_05975 [Talaromyces islandicus]